LNKNLFNDYTIEHICPQNPEDTPHSEEFEKIISILRVI
jgi:hypothetical protein